MVACAQDESERSHFVLICFAFFFAAFEEKPLFVFFTRFIAAVVVNEIQV